MSRRERDANSSRTVATNLFKRAVPSIEPMVCTWPTPCPIEQSRASARPRHEGEDKHGNRGEHGAGGAASVARAGRRGVHGENRGKAAAADRAGRGGVHE